MNPHPIVVIDDEPDVLALVRDVLEEEGLPVVALDHPDRALNVVAQLRPTALFMDLMLPGCDGVELARRLRQSGLNSTPMIAMSASRGKLAEAESSSLFDDTLSKPFELSSLLDCVDRFGREERSA